MEKHFWSEMKGLYHIIILYEVLMIVNITQMWKKKLMSQTHLFSLLLETKRGGDWTSILNVTLYIAIDVEKGFVSIKAIYKES